MLFQLAPTGAANQYKFFMMGVTADNQPDYANAIEMDFIKQGGGMNNNSITQNNNAFQQQTSPNYNQQNAYQQQSSNFNNTPNNNQSFKSKAGQINAKYMGFSFTPPNGWKLAKDDPSIVVLTSDSEPGYIIVYKHEYSNLQQLQQVAMQGFDEEDMQLRPSGYPQTIGNNMFAMRFQGMANNMPAVASGVGTISSYGGGAVIIVIAQSGQFKNSYDQYVQNIANSMNYQQAAIHPEAQRWTQLIAGKVLSRSSSYTSEGYEPNPSFGSISSSTEIHLCSNGQFQRSASSSVSVDVGGVSGYDSGDGSNQGKWKVIIENNTPVIMLYANNGEEFSYSIRIQGNDLYLNDYLYSYDNTNLCR